MMMFQKRRIKKGCFATICSLFLSLVTTVIAFKFVPVNAYNLKIWEEKITFLNLLIQSFSEINELKAHLSLKNERLPKVFFADFNSPRYNLLVSHSHYLGKNTSH